MKNGIDQGKIISPTLWIIYYNPLFERIRSLKNIAYEMNFTPNTLFNRHQSTLSVEVPSIAYMDDTTWITKGKTKMEYLLKITDSFNKYTDI